MTEDEAKAKACCGPRNNSATAENSDVLCIGSLCMAWRLILAEGSPAWERHVEAQMKGAKLGGDKIARERAEDVVRRNDGSMFAQPAEKLSETRGGFCGLAGATSTSMRSEKD